MHAKLINLPCSIHKFITGHRIYACKANQPTLQYNLWVSQQSLLCERPEGVFEDGMGAVPEYVSSHLLQQTGIHNRVFFTKKVTPIFGVFPYQNFSPKNTISPPKI
ncbi:hypothetical protein DPMN_011209 [Dreissena polymorpha]|uniref:Uncharacterized protein n=1 Tax=Dreissena polymorpha TaxID=45954 RepID=A0A9D4N048_DREPO|nr:hypothetical protein DPMN_011209 [Dreissena polymorpha]